MKTRRVFLSAGHSTTPGRDMGAVSADKKHIEGIKVAEFRALVFQNLQDHYGYRASVDSNDSVTSQTIALFSKYTTPRCILIDFHMNAAADPRAQGVETLVPKNPSQFELGLAQEISEAIHHGTSFPLRGNFRGRKGVRSESESQHKRLAWMRVTGENVLVELAFISNPQEMEVWDLQKHQVAKRVADVIWKWANK
jgi:N-acetylmuramoyl-L-alanine amidase